jgi:hypothetical protein
MFSPRSRPLIFGIPQGLDFIVHCTDIFRDFSPRPAAQSAAAGGNYNACCYQNEQECNIETNYLQYIPSLRNIETDCSFIRMLSQTNRPLTHTHAM